MELPKRKPNRLPEYDYSTPNAYFITICTQDRKNLFWTDARAVVDSPENIPLTNLGMTAKQVICDLPRHYPAITVDHAVVMPNHIHLLLQINTDIDGRPMAARTALPSLAVVSKCALKTKDYFCYYVSKEYRTGDTHGIAKAKTKPPARI